MASSASGQDDPNRALWLATRAGKMEPSCLLGTTRCILQAKLPWKPYSKSFIDQVCSVKMAGYWPHSFFASLRTLTSSPSINTQKKNLANIQPSWPHTWSITHTDCFNQNLLVKHYLLRPELSSENLLFLTWAIRKAIKNSKCMLIHVDTVSRLSLGCFTDQTFNQYSNTLDEDWSPPEKKSKELF